MAFPAVSAERPLIPEFRERLHDESSFFQSVQAYPIVKDRPLRDQFLTIQWIDWTLLAINQKMPGVVEAVLQQGREEEFKKLIRDPDAEVRARIRLAVHRGGWDNRKHFDFLKSIMSDVLQVSAGDYSQGLTPCLMELKSEVDSDWRPLFAHEIARAYLSSCHDDLIRDRLVGEDNLSDFLGVLAFDNLLKDLLVEMGRPMLLADMDKWDGVFLRAYEWAHLKGPAAQEFFFQAAVLRPALVNSEAEILVRAYFASQTDRDRAVVLGMAFQSSEFRANSFARDRFVYEVSDEAADLTIQSLEPWMSKDKITDLILERKRLTSEGIKMMSAWLSNVHDLHGPSIYRSIEHWRNSALPLLPLLLNKYESGRDYQEMHDSAVRILLAESDLSTALRPLPKDLRDRALWILAFGKSKSLPSAVTLIEILSKDPGTMVFDIDKDRSSTNALLAYVRQNFKDFDASEREAFRSKIKLIFDLPPDRNTDEVFKPLLKEILVHEKTWEPELAPLIKEME